MLNFENTFLDGLSATGKISAKAAIKPIPRKPVPRKPTPRKLVSPNLAKNILAKGALATKPPIVQAAKAVTKLRLATKPPIVQAAKAVTKPPIVQAAKAVTKARADMAQNILAKGVLSLAAKAPILPAGPRNATAAKAIKAATPIAHACKCQAKPVIRRLNRHMSTCGFPNGTATTLLASIHDMNALLEKAAVQRLSTYEHKKLKHRASFEHDVLSKLAKIAAKLPSCHPTRTKAHLTILKRT